MTDFLGLTWDHPRGRDALIAAAEGFTASADDSLTWAVQPLEGFESARIEQLAARFDLLVLDHPHLGDALEADCLVPLDELFGADELAAWAEAAVGPSAASYDVDGRAWALPLDAATQVSARRPDLLAEAPGSWGEALRLARHGAVAASLAGPHALLSLCSIAISLGETPGRNTDRLVSREVGLAAVDILAAFAEHAPAGTLDLNPIGLLERMSSGDDLAYIPLVYGYVTYSEPTRERPVAFGAPPAGAGGIGSVIGGTGVAITRRSVPTPALLDHLRRLMAAETQSGFIPNHAGQPSARSAWRDPAVDCRAGGFYGATLDTIERSWVRPRFPGWIPFQTAGSALVREALGSGTPGTTLDELDDAYRAARNDS